MYTLSKKPASNDEKAEAALSSSISSMSALDASPISLTAAAGKFSNLNSTSSNSNEGGDDDDDNEIGNAIIQILMYLRSYRRVCKRISW